MLHLHSTGNHSPTDQGSRVEILPCLYVWPIQQSFSKMLITKSSIKSIFLFVKSIFLSVESIFLFLRIIYISVLEFCEGFLEM